MEALQVRLTCGSTETVVVRPGDIVVADRGNCGCSQDLAEKYCSPANWKGSNSRLGRTTVGEDRGVYKRHPKFAHVRRPEGVDIGDGTV